MRYIHLDRQTGNFSLFHYDKLLEFVHLDPDYAIELCYEAWNYNKYWCFLDFCIAVYPELGRRLCTEPSRSGYGEIKKQNTVVVFTVVTRCNKFSIA